MKTNQLDAFLAIAEGKGVAGAAELLCVTQPAITKSINNLEAELGISLFNRESNRLELNGYGDILYRRGRAAKAELTRATEEIALMKKRAMECIMFNGSPAVIPKLVPNAINRFKGSHPNIQVKLAGLLEDSPSNKIEALLAGEFDLLITVIDENEANLGIIYEKLLDMEVIFIASENHPALKLKKPCLKDLVDYDWLLPGFGGLPFQKLRAAFRRSGAQIPENLSTIANRQVIFALLQQGLYLAAIPYHPACFERDLNEFNVLDVTAEKISWPIDLIRRENTNLSPSLSDFINQIKYLVSIKSPDN
ncbi:MAG: LysR family transcriptional regulator [Cellvibrionaceae bacterium]|nr:LysR family transcriptional regulator [Cellvibrionaceae bacterium]|tara:strand:- start:42435 stop:43355 length:921 start_codon:yes stop_codon:yes gene_type:complete